MTCAADLMLPTLQACHSITYGYVLAMWYRRSAVHVIAAQAGTVVMDTTFPSAYEQIMEKAKGLSVRTFALANAVVGNTVIGAPRA